MLLLDLHAVVVDHFLEVFLGKVLEVDVHLLPEGLDLPLVDVYVLHHTHDVDREGQSILHLEHIASDCIAQLFVATKVVEGFVGQVAADDVEHCGVEHVVYSHLHVLQQAVVVVILVPVQARHCQVLPLQVFHSLLQHTPPDLLPLLLHFEKLHDLLGKLHARGRVHIAGAEGLQQEVREKVRVELLVVFKGKGREHRQLFRRQVERREQQFV